MLRYLSIPMLLLFWIPGLMAADDMSTLVPEPVAEAVAAPPGSESTAPVTPASPMEISDAPVVPAAGPAAPAVAVDVPAQEPDNSSAAVLLGGDEEITAAERQAAVPLDVEETASTDAIPRNVSNDLEAAAVEEEGLAEEVPEEPLPSGNMITLKTAYGTGFDAYVVGPEEADFSVMLVHDAWGLNDNIKLRANEIAALGYRALAIDLYDGRVAHDEGLARQVRQSIDPVWADSNLRAALSYLKKKYRKVAVIGWGYGAEQSLKLTLNRPEDIAATIFYYGEPIEDVNVLSAIKGPLFGVFANRSDKIDVEKVATFRDSMLALHKTFYMMRFDTIDGFANPLADAYDERAAGVAWQATQEFLVYSVFRY